MSLLSAYVWFATLVALVFYFASVMDEQPSTFKELGIVVALALGVGSLWPLTTLLCVWGIARN